MSWDRSSMPRSSALALPLALGLGLVILLIHSLYYSFQCDDAYISFRYARNLAEGYGLVFNPGFERVEGYTNFLWVLLLAIPARLGIAAERIANPLSVLISLGLLYWVVLFCWRHRPPGASAWWILFPALFVATNRSYAVWSTGGLETKLFELLTVGGVLISIEEMRAMRRRGDARNAGSEATSRASETASRGSEGTSGAGEIASRGSGTPSRVSETASNTRPGEIETSRGGREGLARAVHRAWKQFPRSVLLLALATLTRPEGLLISASVIGVRVLLQIRERSLCTRPLLLGVATFVGLVGGHFLFRYAYYGAWLPNTFHAKVSGQTWWSMGGKYFASFVFEYGAFLWLPLLVAAAAGFRRWARLEIFLLVAAAIVPHAVYIAAIGGDHFEYRVLDLYVPLLAILLYFGGCALANCCGHGRERGAFLPNLRNSQQAPLDQTSEVNRRWAVGTASYAVLVLFAAISIPILSHLDSPLDYRPGFPGVTTREDGQSDLVVPERHSWCVAIPGTRTYLRHYNELIRETTRHFVGVRQEEHRLFLATVKKQGQWLGDLVQTDALPKDLHVAISCVGAIPYQSRLRTLDRLGLTDREVAAQQPPEGSVRIIAHEKKADPVNAARRGVDLWATDETHLILPLGHPRLHYAAMIERTGQAKPLIADVGGGRYLLAFSMQGIEALERRCPNLNFQPASAYLAIDAEANRGGFVPVPRAAQLDGPYDVTYLNLALAMAQQFRDVATARLYVERALATNPRNPDAARMLQESGLRR